MYQPHLVAGMFQICSFFFCLFIISISLLFFFFFPPFFFLPRPYPSLPPFCLVFPLMLCLICVPMPYTHE